MQSTPNDLDKTSDALTKALSNAKKLCEHQKMCIVKHKDSIKAEYDSKSIFYKFFFDIEIEKDPYGVRKIMFTEHVAKLSAMLRSIELCKEISANVVWDDNELKLISMYAGLTEKNIDALMIKEEEFWCN